MKKILLTGFVLIVLIVGGVGYWLFSSLDSLVKAGIEKYGSEMMQVSVRVDKVKISLSNGEGVISGMHVGNPKGFKTSYALDAGAIDLQVDPASLTKDVILINKIAVVSPNIIYETSDAGSNFDVIQRNVANYIGPSDKKQPEKKMIIETLSIHGAKVAYSPAMLKGKTIDLSLPDIDLHNIGKAKGGVTSSELAKEIIDALKAQLTKSISNVFKGGIDTVKDAAKSVGSGIKGLFK